MSEDRCVCCGEIIPEGTQVCVNCQESVSSMNKCPKCGHKMLIVETRNIRNEILRKRQCKSCGKYTYSSETTVDSGNFKEKVAAEQRAKQTYNQERALEVARKRQETKQKKMNLSEILGKNLCRIMKEKDVLVKELSIDLHISEVTVGKWRAGKALPSPEICHLLANYLGVPVGELLNETS